MKIIESIQGMRKVRQIWRADGQSVGFVPTMGALHRGHAKLLETARKECDQVVLSIFVNPKQFNDKKDFEKYPRTLESDLEIASRCGVDVLFLPQEKELYLDQYHYRVYENEFSTILCGAHRPGHFEGVLTVVLKLLMITQPQRAYFGEKDFQQFLLIRDMVAAFFLDIQIIGVPTVRETDGLAMSSRNIRLAPEHRRLAPWIYKALKSGKSPEEIRKQLEDVGFKVEYVEELAGRKLVAAYLGDVRLIDNA